MTGPLREALADYLTLRRALGFKLARPEKLLGQFVDYLDDVDGEATITVDDRAGLGEAARRRRRRAGGPTGSSVVRGFATYLHALDPATEVPPPDLLPRGRGGPRPTSTPTTTSPR